MHLTPASRLSPSAMKALCAPPGPKAEVNADFEELLKKACKVPPLKPEEIDEWAKRMGAILAQFND